MKNAFLLVLLYAVSCAAVDAANPPDAYDMAIKLFQQGESKKAFSIADDLLKEKKAGAMGIQAEG